MSEFSTIYKLSLLACFAALLAPLCLARCPALECWYVEEKSSRAGSFPSAMSQEKSFLYISTGFNLAYNTQNPPVGINPNRVYRIVDSTGTLCSSALQPVDGAVEKPECEINPFTPHPAMVDWTLSLTSPDTSPAYLTADWLSSSIQGLKNKLAVSSILRLPVGTTEATAVMNVYSHTPVLQTKLKQDVLLDCGFTLPQEEENSEFSLEWRYQYRGEGRLLFAYDAKFDKLHEKYITKDDVEVDITNLHGSGNASLLIKNVSIRHGGTYICTIYRPYLLAQVAMELEIIEPPHLALLPSPFWAAPGHEAVLTCEVSGYYPLDVEIKWMAKPANGEPAEFLTEAQLSGHRQSIEGTFSQTSSIRIIPETQDHLTQYSCLITHLGASSKKSVVLQVAGASGPSIEDAVGMFIVAFISYGLLKLIYWVFSAKASPEDDKKDK
ncbi:tapasin-like [Erpetoichthys calabaricus]|uniref:TAP binding protein (tapasin), tandem duplicate 1 n=1 Tax=Erpetoichthys calabaricus TaxID=27687 RepID=A0A8C4RE35_ERPCA|nr:tapasin-like [Erpetoichthys calabaricus]